MNKMSPGLLLILAVATSSLYFVEIQAASDHFEITVKVLTTPKLQRQIARPLTPVELEIAEHGLSYPLNGDLSYLSVGREAFSRYVKSHSNLYDQLSSFKEIDQFVETLMSRYFAPELLKNQGFGSSWSLFRVETLRFEQQAILSGLLDRIRKDGNIDSESRQAIERYLEALLVSERKSGPAFSSYSLASSFAVAAASFSNGFLIERYLSDDQEQFNQHLLSDLITAAVAIPTTVLLFKAPLFIRYPLAALGIGMAGRDMFMLVTTFQDKGAQEGMHDLGNLSREFILVSGGIRTATRGIRGINPFPKRLAKNVFEIQLVPKSSSWKSVFVNGIGTYSDNRITEILERRSKPHMATTARLRNIVRPAWNAVLPARFHLDKGLPSIERKTVLLARISELEERLAKDQIAKLQEYGSTLQPENSLELAGMSKLKKDARHTIQELSGGTLRFWPFSRGLKQELARVEAALQRHEAGQALGKNLVGREQSFLRRVQLRSIGYRGTRTAILASLGTTRNMAIAGIEQLESEVVRRNPKSQTVSLAEPMAHLQKYLIFRGHSAEAAYGLNRLLIPLKLIHRDFLIYSSFGLNQNEIQTAIARRIVSLWPTEVSLREARDVLTGYFRGLSPGDLLRIVQERTPDLLDAPTFYERVVIELAILRKQALTTEKNLRDQELESLVMKRYEERMLALNLDSRSIEKVARALDPLYKLACDMAYIPFRDNQGGSAIYHLSEKVTLLRYVVSEMEEKNGRKLPPADLRRELREIIVRQLHQPEMDSESFNDFSEWMLDQVVKG